MRKATLLLLSLGLTAVALADAPQLRHDLVIAGGTEDNSAARRDTSSLVTWDFSSGFDGWVSQDLTIALSTWHPDTFNSWDGSRNWWAGDRLVGGYLNHTMLYLELPALNLSETENPLLSFQLYYAIESPVTAPDPWDAWDACHVEVRVSGGDWEILEPTTPAYNAENAFAFDYIFGQEATAGWAGMSNGWLSAECDLTEYRSMATRVRFAFASDNSTAYPTNPTLTGMQLDDIRIDDGATQLLHNNADGIDTPGPTLHYSGVASGGDNWMVSTDHVSADYSLRCNIEEQEVPILNSLTSPYVELPHNYNLFVDFWMKCDMPDADGDGDETLDDYFELQYSMDGEDWTTLFYEYYGLVTGNGQWYHFSGDAGHSNSDSDISFLAGNNVSFRIVVVTDDNNDGGTGSGLFIDDFCIVGEPLLTSDAAVVDVRFPYPRTLNRPISAGVTLRNTGSSDLIGTGWLLLMDNIATEYTGSVDLPVGTTTTTPFTFLPTEGSLHFPKVRLTAGDDFAGNDSLMVPSFIVRNQDVLELANDYAWNLTTPNYQYTTGEGEEIGIGYLQRFELTHVLQEEDVWFELDSLTLRLASFNIAQGETATWQLRIYTGDPATNEPVFSSDYEYEPTFSGGLASADWVSVDLLGEELRMSGAFFVGVFPQELSNHDTGNSAPVPNVTVVRRTWEEPMSASLIDGEMELLPEHQYSFHCFGHEWTDDLEAVELQPRSAELTACLPNPFNPVTQVHYSLDHAGTISLVVYDLLGREVQRLIDGEQMAGSHQVLLDGSAMASGVYLLRLNMNGQPCDTRKVLLVK